MQLIFVGASTMCACFYVCVCETVRAYFFSSTLFLCHLLNVFLLPKLLLHKHDTNVDCVYFQRAYILEYSNFYKYVYIYIPFVFFLTGLRKVYPYYFTFTTFTKGRWVGEKILDVFAREFRAHPAEEYERCIKAGTLTVNYDKVPTDYRLKHNDLLANIVHR